MESSIVGVIATILVILISGLSGFFISLVGGISALIPYLTSATLSVVSSIVGPNSALANGCCICIPIPLAFGIFALLQRAKASALKGPLSQPSADI
jgi:predicted membrane-bound spermidine synthase